MAKLLPLILMILGGAVGAGAGFFLKPEGNENCESPEACEEAMNSASLETPKIEEEPYYVSMKNQFVVPVIKDGLVQSLVVLSLSLETTPDQSETIFARQPKLRDVFLQVLFDHSHIGGFHGAFTESSRLSILKVALLEAAQSVLGKIVTDVIITDIVRQET